MVHIPAANFRSWHAIGWIGGNAMSENASKMTCSCPNGHRVRGDVKLQGSRVRCPKCRESFVFPSAIQQAHNAGSHHDGFSDTSIMRILGDPSKVGIPIVNRGNAASGQVDRFRTCSRCGGSTPKTLAICNHCSCYLGVVNISSDSTDTSSSKISSS